MRLCYFEEGVAAKNIADDEDLRPIKKEVRFMLRSLSKKLHVLVEKYFPDAFVFVILLTVVTMFMGIFITKKTPFEMIQFWYGGFWNFLAFTMQMILILVTGYCLVDAPAIKKALNSLSQVPKTATSALMYTIIVSAAASYFSWGLGLVFGTLFAVAVAKNVKGTDIRLLVAAAYTSAIVVLPASLTITAPLLVNTPGHNLEAKIGLIPLTQTIFGPMLLGIAIITVILMLFVFKAMMPKAEDAVPLMSVITEEVVSATAPMEEKTVANALNNSIILNYIIVIMGLVYIISYFQKGFNLELNILNFIFIMIGLALHKTPRNYMNAIVKAMPTTAGIAFQFGFYAGIMGMMSGAGLISVIAKWFVSFSTPFTFPLWTLVSASVVNIFVPSAGGQWIIQGPIMIEAANILGLPPAIAVNGVTLGDLVTNLFQPFFALITLGLSGLRLRDIWGYVLVAMVIFFIVSAIGVTFFPLAF
jgi:short-chain fatty acids transporter